MLFLFSVSGSKSHVFPLFAAHRPVFSKSLSRFSPPEFSPFPYSLMKNPFPRLCKFSSISGSPGYNLTPLFLFPPPAVIFLAAQNFPSARRFKPRCALFPFAFACPIRGHAPLTLFGFFRICAFHSLSNPPVRFSFGFARCLLPFRPVLGGRVGRVPLARLPRLVFPSCTVSRLSKRRLSVFSLGKPFWAVSRLLSAFFAVPVRGFPAALFGSNAQKKGRQLPAPIFIYIKNFPMYP